MYSRAHKVCQAVARALGETPDPESAQDDTSRNRKLIHRFILFFSIFGFQYSRHCSSAFLAMRHGTWGIEEREYKESFRRTRSDTRQPGHSRNWKADLVPLGDLGYSGSTFLITSNEKYLVKSLDRRFEYRFFMYEILQSYIDHMTTYPESLLARVTDLLYVTSTTLGGLLGLAPTHLIVMENLTHGKGLENGDTLKAQWSTYDLKPDSYFFPERDIADGNLAPESVKIKVVDEMPDPLRVSVEMEHHLFELLNSDTAFLASYNVVDYSLFLVRIPGPAQRLGSQHSENTAWNDDALPAAWGEVDESWRRGVTSVDGEWIYRILIIDFFWARHKLRPKTMSGLVQVFNIFAKKGPMSITTDPFEYRRRFLDMAQKLVQGADS